MSSFIKGLKQGDIILAYRKGFHIITNVERRYRTKETFHYSDHDGQEMGEEYSSLIHYRQIARANGQKVRNSKEWCCDANFCRVLDDSWFQEQLDELEEKRQLIAELREEFRR